MKNDIKYEDFYNEVRRILYNALKSHESIEDIDRFLSTKEAIEEINEKYNDAVNGGYDGTDTDVKGLFIHYTASAATCLDWMYE